jgi:hypothetical protein
MGAIITSFVRFKNANSALSGAAVLRGAVEVRATVIITDNLKIASRRSR